MQHNLLILLLTLFHFIFALLPSFAAVPLRWTVETSRVQPAVFEAYQGETLEFEAELQSRGRPIAAPAEYSFYWQTNGMGSVYWSMPCASPSAPTNVLFATWSPTNDAGARVYTCFIGAPGTIYHAAFQLRLRPSPGAVPNVIEQPPPVLDLAHTVVINPPWPTDQTIDARIRQVIADDDITANVPTGMVRTVVSNTVTKAYVESLGISGGGSSIDTNAVIDIAQSVVAPAVNAAVNTGRAITASAAAAGTNYTDTVASSKADKTNTYTKTESDAKLERKADAEVPDFSIPYEIGYGDGVYVTYIITYKNGVADSINSWWGRNAGDKWDEFAESLGGVITNGINIALLHVYDGVFYSFEMWREYGSDKMTASARRGDADSIVRYVDIAKAHGAYSVVQSIERRIIDPSTATSTGMAADALKTKQSLASKADQADLDPIRTAANDALSYGRGIFMYMNGTTNCYFSGTNYVIGAESTNRTAFAIEDGMDLATVPCSMALWEIRDGTRQCVWDQRDWTVWYWNFKLAQYRSEHDGRDAALRALIAGRCPLNWASYTSCGLTNAAGDTTWIDTPKVVLSAGYAWQHQLTVDGIGYWGISGNGFEVGGSGTNSTLRITDWEGNEVLKIKKGNAMLAYLTGGSGVASGLDGEYMWYDMRCDAQPTGEFTVDLLDTFVEEGDNCPAEVREYEDRGNGVWRCYFRARPGINATACFARFKVQVGTETTVEYGTAPTIPALIVNGRKIAPVIPQNAQVGDTVVWKVVQ